MRAVLDAGREAARRHHGALGRGAHKGHGMALAHDNPDHQHRRCPLDAMLSSPGLRQWAGPTHEACVQDAKGIALGRHGWRL